LRQQAIAALAVLADRTSLYPPLHVDNEAGKRGVIGVAGGGVVQYHWPCVADPEWDYLSDIAISV